MNAPLAFGQTVHIGAGVPRPNALRLLHGRGVYVDDVVLPRMVHVAFFRSPHACCRIRSIDATAAKAAPGVIAVFRGADLQPVCQGWQGILTSMAGMTSGTQHPLALDVARWQGEAIVAVVAESRALAEDAVALLEVGLEELPALVDAEQALNAAPISPEVKSNVCFERRIDVGNVESQLAASSVVVEKKLSFGRQTGVTMEPRGILADYNPAQGTLTIHHSHQAPHMVRDVLAKLLQMRDQDIRVICPDVGGAFGLKAHIYPDEVAAVAISRLLKRPVKFIADRLESFSSDIHARHHQVQVRVGFRADGRITAIDLQDIAPIGPYSVYPRSSVVEGGQIINFTGGPYLIEHYRAWLRVVFQNKAPTSQFRAVGHPMACAVTESMMDEGARKLNLDPLEIRRRNLIPDDAYPFTSVTGMQFEKLSHQKCLERMTDLVNYRELRAQQQAARKEGRHLGIGFAMMIELTNPGPAVYTAGGAPISSQDGATLRLEPSGGVTVIVSVGEQGQGTETVMAQIAADAVGVPMSAIRMLTGDTAVTPMGGGTWGSRAAGIGGEAVWQAGLALKSQILATASELLAKPVETLDIRAGEIVVSGTSGAAMSLAEVAQIGYYRPDKLARSPELMATRHFTPRGYPLTFTNGMQASLVEVDPDTGFVRLLKHWVVEDCGTILNPLLVDEQVRGGVVQGIGQALFEECLYDEAGQLLNGTFADYLVPMAAEMPDIEVRHVTTPTATTQLGAKGAGEAGTCGAPAAILNAVNDALSHLGAQVNQLPITPERVLRALAEARVTELTVLSDGGRAH